MSLPVVPVLMAVLAAAPASAPTPDEQRLFADGQRAIDAGNPRDAIKAWKAGYELRRDPAFLVRIGEAQEKAGAPGEAVESYRRYLREAPDAADRAEITQRIARLDPAAAAPRPPEMGAPAEVPGDFGAAPAGVPPPLPPGAPRAADDESARAADQDDSGWNVPRATAWISVAATAGLLGVAAFYGASAASKKDDVNRLLTYRDRLTNVPLEYSAVAAEYEAAMRDGRRYDRRAKLMLLLAGGTAAVATTFFIIDKVQTSRPEVVLVPDGKRLTLMGGWRWAF